MAIALLDLEQPLHPDHTGMPVDVREHPNRPAAVPDGQPHGPLRPVGDILDGICVLYCPGALHRDGLFRLEVGHPGTHLRGEAPFELVIVVSGASGKPVDQVLQVEAFVRMPVAVHERGQHNAAVDVEFAVGPGRAARHNRCDRLFLDQDIPGVAAPDAGVPNKQ